MKTWIGRSSVVLALSLAFVPRLFGQPQTPPEITTNDSPVVFSSRVNLVSVPVVVRDRAGHAIGNLTQDDFELFDKGKLQVITRFSIEKSEASLVQANSGPGSQENTSSRTATAGSVLPERYIAYLVDDIHLQRGDLLQTRQAMNRHLDESLEPGNRAAIFTTSGLVKADFTGDREKLHSAVNSIQPWTSGPDPQQDCPPVSYYMADLLVNKLLYLSGPLFSDVQIAQLILSGQADQALVAVVAEAEACSHLSLAPPQGSSTPHAVDMTPEPLITLVRTTVRQALTYGDHETSSALGALEDVIRRLTSTPGSRTLVLVSPGFLLTTDHRSQEFDVLDRAIRANVTVNTIDMRGLYTPPGSDASERGHLSTAGGFLTQTEISAASQADDVLEEIADGTGGTFFHNDNDLKGGLNTLAARPEYVYVLGFSPSNLKFDGSYHSLKVKVKTSREPTLQVRRGYWAPNHAVDAAQQARDDIREAVFSRDEIQDIPLDLQTELFKPSEEKAELTVVGRLAVGALRFQRAQQQNEPRNNDTLTIVAGLFDPDGNYVSGIQRVIQMHLRDQTLAALENSGITVKETFHVAPGRYVVRMVVRDTQGHTMAARNQGVNIP
jgi:VWFA-related protein